MTIFKSKLLWQILFAVGMFNFASFMIGNMILGGDAGNGRVEGNRYFLGDHGRYTEVSRFVYVYSKIHGNSLIVIHPLGILAIGMLKKLESDKKRQ